MKNCINGIFDLPGSSQRLIAMEGIRGFAVIAVFFVHYLSHTGMKLYKINFDEMTLDKINNIFIKAQFIVFSSHWGVDIFFLLSGYLIYKITIKDSFRFLHFIKNRIERIYPAFLFSTLIIIVYKAYYGNFSFHVDQFASNMIFLNGIKELKIEPYSEVTWSLFFEFSFYLAFSSLIVALKKLNIRITSEIIIAIGVLAFIFLLNFNHFYLRFTMFFSGVFMATFTAEHLKEKAACISDFAASLTFIASILMFCSTLDFGQFIPVFIFSCYLFVLRAVFGEGWLCKLFCFNYLRYIGNLSYSFYLLHGLAIDFLIWKVGYLVNWMLKIPYFGGTIYLVTTAVACFVSSLILATISFIFFEKPYFNKAIKCAHSSPQLGSMG